mgnify:CR=1 FL=1
MVSPAARGRVRPVSSSWSLPATECSLDRCFLDYRGPVRFQLDLEEEADKADRKSVV